MSMLYSKAGSLLLRIFGLIPLRLARFIACTQELILRLFNNDLHRVSRINLRLVKPGIDEKQLTKLTQQSVQSTLTNAFEMPIIWQHDNAWVIRHIESITNEEIISQALAGNRGVITLCPHVGNWEVFGRKLTAYGPTTYLYQPPKQKIMESLVRERREKSGAKLAPTSQRGIASLLKALRNNEIIGILPDQVPKGESGMFVPFLGVPSYTMTLVYSLIKKTQCRVVLGYALRTNSGFKVIFKQVDTKIYSENIETSLLGLSRTVEQSLSEDFSQYQWGYKRFKKQPDGHYPYKKNNVTA